MNLRSFDLNLLLVFDAVYSNRSITAAAQKLGMTQPAVSNALARLRNQLGDQLFERVGRGIEPTAEAKRVAPQVQQALAAVRNVVAQPEHFDPAVSTREFRMIIADAIEPVIMMPLLALSLKRMTGITYALEPFIVPAFESSILSKSVDLGFFVHSVSQEKLNTVPLFSDATCIIARADHPVYGDKDRFTLDDLSEAPFVALGAELRRISQIEQQCEALGRDRRIVCQTKRVWSVPYMVSASDLVGCLPLRIAEALAEKLNLRIFEPPMNLLPESWHMVWHRDFDDDPGHRWLRQRIQGLFAKAEPETEPA